MNFQHLTNFQEAVKMSIHSVVTFRYSIGLYEC
jgi:hypothetical protein